MSLGFLPTTQYQISSPVLTGGGILSLSSAAAGVYVTLDGNANDDSQQVRIGTICRTYNRIRRNAVVGFLGVRKHERIRNRELQIRHVPCFQRNGHWTSQLCKRANGLVHLPSRFKSHVLQVSASTSKADMSLRWSHEAYAKMQAAPSPGHLTLLREARRAVIRLAIEHSLLQSRIAEMW